MAQTNRIEANTAPEVNRRIEEQSKIRVLGCAAQGDAAISQSIEELDGEWDIERALMTGAGINVLFGVLMGALIHRKWFYWPAVVGSFMLQHTIQGWCPPLIPFRRSGVRTRQEIEREKIALRILRGDFQKYQSVPAASGDDITHENIRQRAQAAWEAAKN